MAHDTDNTPQQPSGHSFSAGEWLSIIGIIALAVAAFVRLEMRVNQLEPAQIKEQQKQAITAIKESTPSSIELPVGTVIASILKPEKFKELYGNKWVPADGRTIIGTELSKAIQKGTMPDFGGMFLRGINTKEDPSTQDPEGIREPGNRQPDEFKSHTHRLGNDYGAASGGPVEWNTYAKIRKGVPPTFETATTGGAETRPRNIAVYLYIKVN